MLLIVPSNAKQIKLVW